MTDAPFATSLFIRLAHDSEEEANLSVQLAQHRINGEVSYGSSQELFLDAVASDGIEMDWQVWDEIAGDLEFWDMNIL